MHAAIELVVFWALAFSTLCLAVFLLALFDGLIENDLQLLTFGKEAAIAGIASFIEAVSVWLIVLYIEAPYRATGMRAMIIPALIVALIYKVAHLEDWNRYDLLLLLMFQVAIGCFGASLITGHFSAALLTLIFFGVLLAGIVFFVRSL